MRMRVYLGALSVHRTEPRANIVFTRTHGFAVQIIWYYCTYSTYAARAGETLRQLPSSRPTQLRAASASLSRAFSSRRDFNIARANVNVAHCAVYISEILAMREDIVNNYYSMSCALYVTVCLRLRLRFNVISIYVRKSKARCLL